MGGALCEGRSAAKAEVATLAKRAAVRILFIIISMFIPFPSTRDLTSRELTLTGAEGSERAVTPSGGCYGERRTNPTSM
jgi:hypothetical protein